MIMLQKSAVAVAVLPLVVCTAGVLAGAAPAEGAGVTCRGVRATIVGTEQGEVIRGTPGRDVIAALGGDDTIYAGGGDDLVCAGDGADQVFGGAGRDRLFGQRDRWQLADEDGVERVGDTLYGGPGDDRLDAGTDLRRADIVVPDVYSWAGSTHGVHLDLRTRTARGEGSDRFAGGRYAIVGSSHRDVVEGTSGRDTIATGAGRDVVRARGGNDVVVVDELGRRHGAADRVWGGPGRDRIEAGGGEDLLSGGPGDDMIEAKRDGNDRLRGGPGNDVIFAQIQDSGGPQSFSGGRGTDSLQVGTDLLGRGAASWTGIWNMASGAMTLTSDHAVSLTVSGIDRAVLATRRTSWTVTGTSGDDSISGDTNSVSSPVSFRGLAGNDTFRGTDGDDVFDGGPGTDHSFGMFDGDDTCISVEIIDGSDCEHVS